MILYQTEVHKLMSKCHKNLLIHNFSGSQTLISQFFVSQIFSPLNPFVPVGAKDHTYLNKLASKSCRFVLSMYDLLLPLDMKG